MLWKKKKRRTRRTRVPTKYSPAATATRRRRAQIAAATPRQPAAHPTMGLSEFSVKLPAQLFLVQGRCDRRAPQLIRDEEQDHRACDEEKGPNQSGRLRRAMVNGKRSVGKPPSRGPAASLR